MAAIKKELFLPFSPGCKQKFCSKGRRTAGLLSPFLGLFLTVQIISLALSCRRHFCKSSQTHNGNTLKLTQAGFRIFIEYSAFYFAVINFSGLKVGLCQFFGHPERFAKNSERKAQHKARWVVSYLFGQS